MDRKPTYEELLQKVKELEEKIFEKKRAEEEFETQQEMLFSARTRDKADYQHHRALNRKAFFFMLQPEVPGGKKGFLSNQAKP